MKKLFILVLLIRVTHLEAQYFYNDIIGTGETTNLMKFYLENKIKKVTSNGFDAQGLPAKNYKEEQEVNETGMQLKISTFNDLRKSTITYSFDKSGRLIGSVDISNGIKSTTDYTYNNEGKIILIINSIVDSLQDFNQTEIHQWLYKNGSPEKMWRIINKSDTLEVWFKPDENGNVIEEQNSKKGKGTDPIYYYYDEKNRLTDIVRFNNKVKKLLPDFLFEYDESNRVIQKITTTSNNNMGYLTWRYLYNEKGLKTKEALFNKEKKLQGRIEYTYIY